MATLNSLGLRTKIALPFAITAIALIVVGIFSVSTTRILSSHTNQVTTTYLPSVSEILNGDRNLYQALVAQKSLLDHAFNNEDTAAAQDSFNENTEQARTRFEESVERLSGTGVSAEAEGFAQAFDRWEQSAPRDADSKANNSARIIKNSSQQVHRLAAQISRAVEAIRKLSEDSDNITSVLDVIRGVADQTNLLALNAAIEAARAGEQGRGFAVVADEVRTLAQRTQQSTEDIQTMITSLQTGVSNVVNIMESGSKEASETEQLASEAEQELQSILEAISNITDVNTSVASATEEQTQVVDEINRSITEINDLASEGAERSRAIDGISKSLDGYATELKTQTERFRV